MLWPEKFSSTANTHNWWMLLTLNVLQDRSLSWLRLNRGFSKAKLSPFQMLWVMASILPWHIVWKIYHFTRNEIDRKLTYMSLQLFLPFGTEHKSHSELVPRIGHGVCGQIWDGWKYDEGQTYRNTLSLKFILLPEKRSCSVDIWYFFNNENVSSTFSSVKFLFQIPIHKYWYSNIIQPKIHLMFVEKIWCIVSSNKIQNMVWTHFSSL